MEPSDDRSVPLKTLLRWSEALAGIARTGLGFTESLYEQERFEEILKVAADIRVEADGGSDDPDHAGGLVQEWMDTVGTGVPGYVTPKVAVGAAVGNDKGELLLIQRADSGIWLYPTGWCDVGYSAAEVVVKEVEEETGIEVEPVRLIAVLDGLRLGFTRVPLYSLLFYCRAVGGELAPHPLETRDVGWFTRDTLPQPLVGSERWGEHVFAAINGERARRPLRQRAPAHVARRLRHDVISVRVAASVDADLVAAVTALLPQLSRSAPPPTPEQLARIVAGPATTLFVAEDDGRIVGPLTLVAFEIPTGPARLDRGRGDRHRRARQGRGQRPGQRCAVARGALGARTVDLTSRPDRDDANRLYVKLGFEQRATNVYRRTASTPGTELAARRARGSGSLGSGNAAGSRRISGRTSA